jgi:hypothetical protein
MAAGENRRDDEADESDRHVGDDKAGKHKVHVGILRIGGFAHQLRGALTYRADVGVSFGERGLGVGVIDGARKSLRR